MKSQVKSGKTAKQQSQSQSVKGTARKTYILDTNVLLSDDMALYSFAENGIVLPLIVIEELDRKKNAPDEVGRNARETVRRLSALASKHKDLKQGAPLNEEGGTLKVLGTEDIGDGHVPNWIMPAELDPKSADNIIIAFCKKYKSVYPGEKTVLITQDMILRIKAEFYGIDCEDYKKFNVADSTNQLYNGVATISVPVESIDGLYAGTSPVVLTQSENPGLFPNQFLVLKDKDGGEKSALGMFTEYGSPIQHIRDTEVPASVKIAPRNKEQRFAMRMLFDPNIKLVTMAGSAGTGKTLCAIAAGLDQVINKKHGYRSLVVCRPVQPVGKDIGFLPGDVNEKLEPWLAPIKDNLRFLLGDGKKTRQGEETLGLLFENGTIEVQALTYIRGRSISNAYMIIEEAQNLSPHELKTIITRVGENTKIVLDGDIEQIDAMNLNSFSNGLTIAIEKFKPYSIAAHVTLTKGERSKLATLAATIF